MSFIGCNIIGSYGVGSKIYQPIISKCNYTLFSDGTKIDFDEFGSPMVGRMNLNNDHITGTFTAVDFTGNWLIEIEAESTDPADPFDHVLRLNGTASESLSLFWNGSSMQLIINDSGGVVRCNTTIAPSVGNNVIKIQRVGTAVTLSFNANTVTVPVVDLSAGCNFDEIFIGAQSVNLREFPAYFSYVKIDIVDNWNLINRLPALTDSGKIVGYVNFIELTVNDDSPFGVYYPYIGSYPSVYTERDYICGSNKLLLDDNNIALQADDGAFLFGD